MPETISLPHKFSLFTDHWRPRVIARLNGQEIKVIVFTAPQGVEI